MYSTTDSRSALWKALHKAEVKSSAIADLGLMGGSVSNAANSSPSSRNHVNGSFQPGK